MRFEDLNWMDVESYLQHDDRLMLVIGATEQHGYLSLFTDIKIPLALADAASQQSNVLIAPPLNFGCSPYFLTYPGTLSLRISTLLNAVEDLIRSAVQTGFRRILIINGHGGNSPVRGLLSELANSLPDIRLDWYSWWLSPSAEAVAAKHGLDPQHANWLEAFPFTIVGELPAAPKPLLQAPNILSAAATRKLYGDGSFGGPYQASEQVMDEMFAACVEDILRLLEFK